MSLGQILETHLGWRSEDGDVLLDPVFDGATIDEIKVNCAPRACRKRQDSCSTAAVARRSTRKSGGHDLHDGFPTSSTTRSTRSIDHTRW
jgi:DNA-directed RNA polymerase beta subunit